MPPIVRKIGTYLFWLVEILGLLQVLRWLHKLLGFGEHIEFIAHYAHYLGRLGVVIEVLLDPPPALGLAIVVVGLLLIWWRVGRRQAVPATVLPPRDTVTENNATPRGDKLIAIGQAIIIGVCIAAFVGVLIGLLLIVIGGEQNARQISATIEAARNPPKAPIAEPALPPIAVAPAPIVEAPVTPPPSVTPPPAADPPPPTLPEKPPREFVDAHVTPKFLVGLYEGQTTLGAERLTKKYIGKWMPVSGTLFETVGGFPIFGGRTPVVASFANYPGPSVIMLFRDEWIDRLAMISKDQTIFVHGEIKDVGSSKVVLDNCEIVDSDSKTQAPNAPAASPKPSTRPRRRRSAKGKQPPASQ